ncbi:MAG TPA: GNVR domain-containing protein, partial [Bacteroidales bacterium]|nr:GNVR domain-containing protein [Bacteroidales bacterium]
MDQYPEIYREEESIDIKKYLYRILYNWWWFALSIFLALTIAYLINRYSEDIYRATCSVIIANENTPRGDIESVIEEMTNIRNRRTKAVVQNEITVLKSYKMASAALDKLDFTITYTAVGRRGIAESKLYNSSPFIVIPDTSKPNLYNYPVTISILSPTTYRITLDDKIQVSEVMYFGQVFEHENFHFTLLPRTTESLKNLDHFPLKYYFILHDKNGLVNRYRAGLSVEVNDEKGSILTLSLTGPNKDQICDYLNKLSQVYIQSNLDEKNTTSSNTIRFIDQQLRETIDSLQIAGVRLQNFRSANRIINISQEGNALFQQMEQLNTEKAEIDIQGRYFEYIKSYIDSKKHNIDIIAPSVMGIQDALLNSLVSQINTLNTERRNLQFSSNENNPRLTMINMQLENLRMDIVEIVNNLIESNRISMAELQRRINNLEGQIQKLPATERQLINIQREFNINDQIYTFLLEKRAEAGITKASNTSDHRLLDMARPENAVMIKPKTSMNYMMALVLGGLLPLMLLILIEYFNNKIVDKKDIEQETSVPILGSIGHNDKSYDLPVFENPKSALAESFRSLRANLQYLLKNETHKIISISSTISGEGKTFCSANLSAIMAMAGRKTLLISLDLRKPKIHKIFSLNNDKGISSYLAGINQDPVIFSTNIQNLSVAVSGP